MAHSYYYAIMGGHAVDIARAPQILFPGNRSLLALTTSEPAAAGKKEPDTFRTLLKRKPQIKTSR